MRVGRRHAGSGAARRGRGDGGAALVEFALVAPLLFLVLFAIMEFGWAFLQYQDTRHGARETARLAAVDYTVDSTDTASERRLAILKEGCARMDSSSNVAIEMTRADGTDDGTDTFDVGDVATVHVRSDLDTLTGFLDWAIGNIDLDSTVEIRLEQKAEWESVAGLVSCNSIP